jgi:hypothetical protein
LACLELEGREGVGRASEQRRGVELLLESIAEAAPRLAVQYQPPLRGLAGRSCGAESAEGRLADTRREAGSGAGERGQRRRHRLGSAALGRPEDVLAVRGSGGGTAARVKWLVCGPRAL